MGGGSRADNLSPDKYRSKDIIKVANKSTQDKYMKIYADYVENNLTEQEVADKYDLVRPWVSKIIKWVVFETDMFEPDDHMKITDDKLTIKLKRLQELLNECVYKDKKNQEHVDVYKKLAVESEIRRTIKLQAQVRKVLGKAQLNIIMPQSGHVPMKNAPSFREGAKTIEVDNEE